MRRPGTRRFAGLRVQALALFLPACEQLRDLLRRALADVEGAWIVDGFAKFLALTAQGGTPFAA
jgi:hypothetical protein